MLGAKVIPFAGWEMPVWYTSVMEEHLATRQAAGLFDVAHMGVYSVEGADAASFLDTICANDCGGLAPGESLYSQFLTPDADVIDDTLVYRRAWDKYLVVVNASNDDKDRAWFEAVRDGTVRIATTAPGRGPTATRPSSATCATRKRATTCGLTLRCRDRNRGISCWRWG
jgi:glycine hydroxymethyltransferase